MPAISFTLSPINQINVTVFRMTRLAALLESPSAFGSTYANESQISDAEWLQRAIDWSSDRRIGFLAKSQNCTCGIVGGCFDEHDLSTVHLISMWVAPTHRRYGIGTSL